MEIGTVDGMQGREKDAVIISLVRSNEKVNAFTHFLLVAKRRYYSERLDFSRTSAGLTVRGAIKLPVVSLNQRFQWL